LSKPSRLQVILASFTAGACLGCWEQLDSDWFPQMKRQLAVQAFEKVATVPKAAATVRWPPLRPSHRTRRVRSRWSSPSPGP